METNWDLLIENHFNKKEALAMDMLVEMVEETLDEMATLGWANFNRNPGRFEEFIRRVENGEPFIIDATKKKVIIQKSEPLLVKLRALANSGDISAKKAKELGIPDFTTTDGEVYSISKFFKDPGMGGEEAGKRTAKEAYAMKNLEALIKTAIKESGTDGIILRVLNSSGEVLHTYDDVIGVKTQKQPEQGTFKGVDPKSDFVLIRKDPKSPVFISHKDGTTAKHFGQWSGVTSKAGEKINGHPEVLKFIEDLKGELGQDRDGNYIYPNATTYRRVIKNPDLINMALFGPDYTPDGPGSFNNVDVVAQGIFKLERVGTDPDAGVEDVPEAIYTLSAHHMMVRGDDKYDFGKSYQPTLQADDDEQDLPGPYSPALVSRFATQRSNFNVKGLRATIYPYSGRKVTKDI